MFRKKITFRFAPLLKDSVVSFFMWTDSDSDYVVLF